MNEQQSRRLKSLDALADLLDTKFRGPFGWRFGLDGILGLIPGVGDLVTNVLAAYIILKATWHGYPGSVILRMFLNFLFDNLLDAIPFLGNILDFFFKANTRNLSLMRAYELDPDKVRQRSFVWVVAVMVALVFIMGALIVGSFVLAIKIVQWLVTL